MKRLRRWLVSALVLVSMTLMTATAILWIRGHFGYDLIGHVRIEPNARPNSLNYEHWGLEFGAGALYAEHQATRLLGAKDDRRIGSRPYWHRASLNAPTRRPEPPMSAWLPGFGFGHPGIIVDDETMCVVVPYWALLLTFSLMPAVWAVKYVRRRHRFTEGCCKNCGYDLRATPDRCPECGTEVVKGPVAKV